MISFVRLRIFWFLILTGVSVLSMFVADVPVSFFRNILFSSSNVVRNLLGRSAVLLEQVSGTFITRKTMQRENARLKKTIAEYEARLRSINSLEFENAKLRDILEFSLSIDYNLLPAQIIAVNGEGADLESVLVDRGSTKGVSENMAVVGIYNNELVVVGTVSQVTLYTAQFIPITHANFSVPAQTHQSEHRGVLSGYKGKDDVLVFTSDAIYDDSNFIFVGEQVVVNAYSKFLPRGMLIGVVVKVSSGLEDRMARSYVRPYLTATSVDYVFIIIPKKTNDKNTSQNDEENFNSSNSTSVLTQ